MSSSRQGLLRPLAPRDGVCIEYSGRGPEVTLPVFGRSPKIFLIWKRGSRLRRSRLLRPRNSLSRTGRHRIAWDPFLTTVRLVRVQTWQWAATVPRVWKSCAEVLLRPLSSPLFLLRFWWGMRARHAQHGNILAISLGRRSHPHGTAFRLLHQRGT